MLFSDSNRFLRRFFDLGRRYRLWVVLGIAMLTAGLFLNPWTQRFVPLQNLDLMIYDWRMLWRGPERAPDDIAIVAVAQSSLDMSTVDPEEMDANPVLRQMGSHWPWDRSVHAAVLEYLCEAGAKAVIFDFIFMNAISDGDYELADVIEAHKEKVVLACKFHQTETVRGENGIRMLLPFDDLIPLEDEGILGFVNVYPSSDGVIRSTKYRTTLLREKGVEHPNDNAFFPALGAAGARRSGYLGPFPENGTFINFFGREQDIESRIAKVDVEELFLSGRPHLQKGAFFEDKIVFYGPWAEDFKDSHPTPFGRLPGVEIQANLLATVINQSHYSSAGFKQVLKLTLLLIAGAALVFLKVKSVGIRGAFIFPMFLGVIVIPQYLFQAHHVFLPVAAPSLALFCFTSFFFIHDFASEQYERSRVRSILDRYVNSNVADLVVNDRQSFENRLKGKRQPITVFFSDIRSFTTMSEMMDPEELVAQLNEYFLEMVDIVLQENGSLQKFIGDAIMAVWGDTYPLDPKQGALSGVRVCLKMCDKLKELNAMWKAKGVSPLAIGMGVNFGDAVVGNIGHPKRMEFTVLGDAVNLAARLEGTTKQYGLQVLVGEQVFELTKDEVLYRLVDRIRVKGKLKAVEIYEPLALKADAGSLSLDWLEDFNRALACYFKCDFEAAKRAFVKVAETREGGDEVSREFLERCQSYLNEPPEDGWDGVYIMTTK